ncbi:uncharacterized protein LOC133833030 [Humulus lupulus]|uniref:uncharacterized protein LOC133833030 n=1 Tax=Humulus lupulus TaxID=3486 RepID=UPI002B406B4C|nr:uncharacterized protein LOC133833030 [Humulus lupulus]
MTETPDLSAQLAALTAQMNEEREKMRRLEAENADLLVRMEAMSSQATEAQPSCFRGLVSPMQPLGDLTPISNSDGPNRTIPSPSITMTEHGHSSTPRSQQILGVRQLPRASQPATGLGQQQVPSFNQPTIGASQTIIGASQNIPEQQTIGLNHPVMSEPIRQATTSSFPIQVPDLARKLAEIEALIQRIPEIPAPIKKSAASCYAGSPFIDDIALVEIPKKFNFPNMKMFDWTSDPDDHIAQYRQRMFTVAIPRDLREACMCKGLGFSLIGPALQWYTNLPNNSIFTFAQLTNTFVEQFASSRKLEKSAEDLYIIVQRRGETLQEYIGRFYNPL